MRRGYDDPFFELLSVSMSSLFKTMTNLCMNFVISSLYCCVNPSGLEGLLSFSFVYLIKIINLLLTECEGRTGEYWPEVVTVRNEGQYFPVRPKQARFISSLLYGTLFLIVKCTSGGLHSKNVRLLHLSLKFRKNFNLFSFCW